MKTNDIQKGNKKNQFFFFQTFAHLFIYIPATSIVHIKLIYMSDERTLLGENYQLSCLSRRSKSESRVMYH